MKLPEIKIEINGIEYENSFADDVRIDRTDLDNEFARQAETYAYYAFLAEEAKAVHERKKFECEQLYAKIDYEKRQAAESMKIQVKSFKYTEKMCENEVLTDPRYSEKKEEVLKARLLAGQLQQAAVSISQRRDMLQQMGASARVTSMPQRVLEEKQQVVRNIIQNEPTNSADTSEPAQTTRRKPK